MDYNKDFNKSDKIKIEIIKILSDFHEHTPSEIALRLQTNGKTILNNCNFLKLIGLVDIEKKVTKRTAYYIKLKEDLFTNNINNILENFNHL